MNGIMSDTTERLIQLYRAAPPLWNIHSDDYHYKLKRNSALQEIGSELNLTGECKLFLNLQISFLMLR